MFYRIWQVALIAAISSSAGLNYTLYTWFDYKMLGIGNGALHQSLIIWGYISMGLGILMFGTLAFRKIINVKMVDKPLEIFMVIIFVMQLPLISLWLMSLMMQGAIALVGTAVHAALLILIGYCFFTTHRTPKHLKDQPGEDEADLT